MDPNEVLAGMRALVAQVHNDEVAEPQAHNVAMAEQFEALDEWLSHEGFLPGAWAIAGERG
jgi:hypothetical protein